MSEQDELNASIEELINSIKGLSLEVEGMRVSSDSTAYFIIEILKDLMVVALALQVKINAKH